MQWSLEILAYSGLLIARKLNGKVPFKETQRNKSQNLDQLTFTSFQISLMNKFTLICNCQSFSRRLK